MPKSFIAAKGFLLLLAAGVVIGFLGWNARRASGTTVHLRISVVPAEQVQFVSGQANSARFKYLTAKQAGIKPALAQKLTVKPVPNSALLEAELRVATQEDAQKFAAGFAETLQLLCGTQAQVHVVPAAVR